MPNHYSANPQPNLQSSQLAQDYHLPLNINYHLTVRELHGFIMDRFFSNSLFTALMVVIMIGALRDGANGAALLAAFGVMIAVFLIYGLMLAVLSFWCRPALMMIDRDGITETMNGKTKHWAWQKVQKITLDERYLSVQLGAWYAIIPLAQIGENDAIAIYRRVRAQKALQF
ncbi:hypothetical protein B0181_10960 [Moraxella caviae]|uniref:YcxB-like protein domain-containing protein n=1 Tax=Moraxella caviae TaxID=34060 RepID=A0A1S9ZUR1_9GAMM|nr:YcxB family protein [Moraxella caviae]OOR87137.1 hypothetical protein B0181_10960 [Moraxella caviae]STZ14786.1 Uncharacterised protein [Moraxella caviae]VEW13953.1 Uncharacterised protein [Moraxella caviae]